MGQIGADAPRREHQSLQVRSQQIAPLLCVGPGSVSDHGADARTGFQPFLREQMLDDLVRGIRVNLKIGGDRANRGERLADGVLAAQYRRNGRQHDLIENRDAAPEIEIKYRHIANVTPRLVRGQQ